MSLSIQDICFTDFRNYESFQLHQLERLTIFVGKNAVGKTNIIEGIQLITALESLKHAKADQLIRWSAEHARIAAQFTDTDRVLDIELVIDSEGKHYKRNGKKASPSTLKGTLPSVVFSPDDLQLIKGSPSLRRNELDTIGCQLSKNYTAVKHDYEKILHQKNLLLKDQVSPLYMASVNEVLAKVAAQLYIYRVQILSKIKKIFPLRYRDITGSAENVSLELLPSWEQNNIQQPTAFSSIETNKADLELFFSILLAENAELELSKRRALIGPHLDKPSFFINDNDAATFGSQGQQRSLAIALKLTELQLIEDTTGQQPLLLLDDVMSELDASRRASLIEYVEQATQTFITTTTLEYFTPELLSKARVVALPLPVSGFDRSV